MAKQLQGVYENILEYAKIEFLEKGFNDASLRIIAQNANTSTNSIYVRFSNKEGLFEALVLPVAKGMKAMLSSMQSDFNNLPSETQKQRATQEFASDQFSNMISYIYEHFDIFKLLITCSFGTPYENFIHELTEIDVECSLKFLEQTDNDAIRTKRATPQFLHLLSNGFYSGIFEVVVHNISREAAEEDINRLRRFYLAGWETILKSE